MKNFLSIFLISLLLIVFIFIGVSSNKNINSISYNSEDILRIHVRANSNLEEDQSIKYKAKDLMLEYISNDIINLKSKTEVIKYFNENKQNIEYLISEFLEINGYDYKASLRINKEYFPTRVYNETKVDSGYYDAVILNLGDGEGENWWCIAYPTLCFEDYQNSSKNIVYKSRLLDIINKILK